MRLGHTCRAGCRMVCAVIINGAITSVLLAAPPAEKAHSPAAKKPPTRAATNAVEQTVYETKVKPFLAAHCFKCHDDNTTRAGFRIDTLGTDFLADKTADHWKEIYDKLGLDKMPPKEEARPKASDVTAVMDWIDQEIRNAEKTGQEFVRANAAVEPHGILQHASRSVRSRRTLRPQSGGRTAAGREARWLRSSRGVVVHRSSATGQVFRTG